MYEIPYMVDWTLRHDDHFCHFARYVTPETNAANIKQFLCYLNVCAVTFYIECDLPIDTRMHWCIKLHFTTGVTYKIKVP